MPEGLDIGQLVTQLGLGGFIVYLVIKEVFAYLRSRDEKRRNGNGDSRSTSTGDMFKLLRHIEDLTRDLHSWHDAKDEDQVFVWYVRKSLEREIGKLGDAVTKMVGATEAQTQVVGEALTAVLEELQELRNPKGQDGG